MFSPAGQSADKVIEKLAQKNTVASRIDPVTLAKLKALRDGAGR